MLIAATAVKKHGLCPGVRCCALRVHAGQKGGDRALRWRGQIDVLIDLSAAVFDDSNFQLPAIAGAFSSTSGPAQTARRRCRVGGHVAAERAGFRASWCGGHADIRRGVPARRAVRKRCSTSNATGTGLRGDYFARDLAHGELLLTRTDATVDFDNGFEWPASQAGRRQESARWTGWVKSSIAGRYKFHVE